MADRSLVSIVDDDQLVRESIGRLLRSYGYPVESFPSAAGLLAFPHLDETACLVADINMPGMTGLELHRQLTSAGRRIPTILITAYPDEAVRLRALADGVLCYLGKPFNDSEMLRCVRMALGETP